MALPKVQQVKLEQLRIAETAKAAASSAQESENAARMMVSMTPNAMADGVKEEIVEPIVEAIPVVTSTSVESASNNTQYRQEETKDTQYEELQQQITDFKQKWKSVSGKYEKAKYERDEFSVELEKQKTAIKELQEKLTTTQESKVTDFGLDDRELSVYSEAVPTIQKIAKKMAEEMVAKELGPLQEQLSELKTSTSNVKKTLTNNSEQAFHSQVKNQIPDLENILGTQPWADFLDKRVPYTNITFKQALANAVNSFDVDSAVDIFKAFKPKSKANGLATMVTPAMSPGSSVPSITKEEKPILKLSERKKASTQFIQGKITKQKMQEIQDLYAIAEKEGRVDFAA